MRAGALSAARTPQWRSKLSSKQSSGGIFTVPGEFAAGWLYPQVAVVCAKQFFYLLSLVAVVDLQSQMIAFHWRILGVTSSSINLLLKTNFLFCSSAQTFPLVVPRIFANGRGRWCTPVFPATQTDLPTPSGPHCMGIRKAGSTSIFYSLCLSFL